MKPLHPMCLLVAALLVATATFSFMAHSDKPQPFEAAPVTAQLHAAQAEADELMGALTEDVAAMKARSNAYRLAAEAGTDTSLVDFAWEEANRAGLDPLLVLAVIEQESGWNVNAINHNSNGTTDEGLGQINSGTWPSLAKALNLTDPMDPRQNIKATVYYLSYLSRQYTSTAAILTSYNRGEEGLHRWYVSRGTVRSPYSDEVERRMYR